MTITNHLIIWLFFEKNFLFIFLTKINKYINGIIKIINSKYLIILTIYYYNTLHLNYYNYYTLCCIIYYIILIVI